MRSQMSIVRVWSDTDHTFGPLGAEMSPLRRPELGEEEVVMQAFNGNLQPMLKPGT